MKNHVKSLETFVNESGAYPVSVSSTANGTAGVPTTATGADSEDSIIPQQVRATGRSVQDFYTELLEVVL